MISNRNTPQLRCKTVQLCGTTSVMCYIHFLTDPCINFRVASTVGSIASKSAQSVNKFIQ